MNHLMTRREKMKKRFGSLRCCLTVFLKVAVLMLTCFEEISGIVVITPAPIRLLNDTAGENCSGVLDGLPRVSVAPDSINYIGTYPRPWIHRTHEIFATSSAETQHANVSDLSTERGVLFTEKPHFLNQTNQNQTLSTSYEDPTTMVSNTYEDKSVTESSLISSFSKLNHTSISAKPLSFRITHMANTFKTSQTPYLQTSTPNLKPFSSKTEDTSYKPSMTTQTFTIKQTFPKKRHTSVVYGKIKMLNQTHSVNLKKSHKLNNKVIDTPPKNSLLTNIITHEHSPKNYGSLSKYSALPSNSNLLLSQEKSSVRNRPTEKPITPKIKEINRNHSSKTSTQNSITTSGKLDSLTATSIFDIITDFTSAFFFQKSEKLLNKATKSSLAKQLPELSSPLKQLNIHSEPLNLSEKLNIPLHKNLYTFEELSTPPLELFNPSVQLNIPPSEQLNPSVQLNTLPSELLNPSVQLNTPLSELLNPSLQLNTPPSELLNPSVQLNTPPSGLLNPSLQLNTPPSELLNPSVQLNTPPSELLNPSLQLNTPPSELLNPSVQLNTPPSELLNPSLQLNTPPSELLIPSVQLNTPSPLLNNSEPQSTASAGSLNSSEQLIIPSYATITKAEPIDLRSLEKELNSVLASRLPLALDPDLLYLWRAPYLQRLRHSNHEMVDIILQSEVRTPPESSECPNDYQKVVLLNLQRMLGLLLLTLPQSLKEVEEIIWNPDLENYLFRPQGKAILDVTTCKGSCYTMDSQGLCREIFFCKDGTSPGLAPRLSPEQLRRLLAASSG
ncbi:mucin-3A-like [Palaemon carinicauda]|uniref:mucin-3A-like n=1 Tax=Palaemon carinicauda TaxID=392227 RepID=UPI0035B6840D